MSHFPFRAHRPASPQPAAERLIDSHRRSRDLARARAAAAARREHPELFRRST